MAWRKSTASGADACCVWVDIKPGMVLVRSDDPDGPVLTFTTAEWQCFIDGVRAGEFEVLRPGL